MNPIAILKEVEADVKAFGTISGDIRTTLKGGVADLTAIRDEMKALVEAVKGKATGALASLRALADEVSKDADGGADDQVGSDGEGGSGEASTPVVDAADGTTVHTAADGTVTTLDHAAGAVTARDAGGAAVLPPAEAVQAVVQATVDAGVTLPEVLISGADVQAPAADPAPQAPQPVI